jgi:outer membrane usher protein
MRVGFIYFLGNLASASAVVNSSRLGTNTTLELTRSLGLGSGYGYRLDVRPGSTQVGGALLQYQNEHGRYEVSADKARGNDTVTATVTGAVVSIGGGLYFTRPVGDGFALIRVPGVAGVPGYLSNQEVGRTNARGNLVIPGLLPYYANDIRIGTDGIPFNYSIGTRQETVAPPYRSGAIVTFPVVRIQVFTGRLRVRAGDRTMVPSYGELIVITKTTRFSSPLGSAGDFYFENLPPGNYAAEVGHSGGTCRFDLHIPTSDNTFVDLGEMICRQP